MPHSTDRPPLKVLHLDHSASTGGAELALSRIAALATGWLPALSLPPQPRLAPNEPKQDVFENLAGRVPILTAGVVQRSGATANNASAVEKLFFVVRVLLQAVLIRLSSGYRSCDLIHCNTSRAAVYGLIAATLLGRKPVIVHVRDMVTVESLGRMGHFALSRLLRRATGIIACSRAALASAEPYLAAGVPREIIASPIGFGCVPTRPIVGSNGVLKVVMVARLDEWKGQELLIRAFARAYRGAPARLHLAGSALFGKQAYEFSLRETVQELGVTDQVEFCGQLRDIRSFLIDADIAVQCSLRPEPLGQNVLQYLTAGVATIAANAGGPADWISSGVNGLLVPMGDEVALSAALARLGAEPEFRVELGHGARRTPGLLSDAEIVQKHGDFFQKVMDHA